MISTRALTNLVFDDKGKKGIVVLRNDRPWLVTNLMVGFSGVTVSLFPNDLGKNEAGVGTRVVVALADTDDEIWTIA